MYRAVGSDENPSYASDCDSISRRALYMKVIMGSVIDFFKPVENATWCDMLQSTFHHLWSPDGENWVQPSYWDYSVNVGNHAVFGGSGVIWLLQQQYSTDHREWLSFWGTNATNLTGGCCHYTYSESERAGWGRAFELHIYACSHSSKTTFYQDCSCSVFV